MGFVLAAMLGASGARAAQVQVDWVDALPGQTVSVGASLATSPGEELAAVSLDVRFDADRLGEPLCSIDLRIGPGTAADKGLQWSLPAPGRMRAAVVGINLTVIPPGSLFSCDFEVDAKAPGGELPLASSAQAATPSGASATITATSGGVRIDPDPDGDGQLYTGTGTPCSGGQGGACEDNCPFVANADQRDSDGDDVGDACECGDVSGDGRVSTLDARLAQRCGVGQLDAATCSGLCDVTGDGRCTAVDARILQRVAVGEIPQAQLVCDAQSFQP